MLQLSNEYLIGCGGHRKVYRHPEDHHLCIKIDIRQSVGVKGITEKEIDLFERILKSRRGKRFSAIANFHGSVETNEGLGAVFELIVDEGSNTPSQSLYYEMCRDHSEAEKNKLALALKTFRKCIIKDAIVCNDISPFNVCVQKKSNGEIKLILIDGVGHPKFEKYTKIHAIVKLLRHFWRRKFSSYSRLQKRCFGSAMRDKHEYGERQMNALLDEKNKASEG